MREPRSRPARGQVCGLCGCTEEERVTCPLCEGSGETPDDWGWPLCPECDGSGVCWRLACDCDAADE